MEHRNYAEVLLATWKQSTVVAGGEFEIARDDSHLDSERYPVLGSAPASTRVGHWDVLLEGRHIEFHGAEFDKFAWNLLSKLPVFLISGNTDLGFGRWSVSSD
jgi:hypothetical protein